MPRKRQLETPDSTLLAELLAPGGEPGEAEDQPPKAHRPEPGTHAYDERERDQPNAGRAQQRRPLGDPSELDRSVRVVWVCLPSAGVAATDYRRSMRGSPLSGVEEPDRERRHGSVEFHLARGDVEPGRRDRSRNASEKGMPACGDGGVDVPFARNPCDLAFGEPLVTTSSASTLSRRPIDDVEIEGRRRRTAACLEASATRVGRRPGRSGGRLASGDQ